MAASDSGAATEASDGANAANSFLGTEGGEAGANGTRWSAGLAQHAGVEQCRESQPLRQHFDFAPTAMAPTTLSGIEKTPCHATTNPNKRTIAVLANRDVMVQIGRAEFLLLTILLNPGSPSQTDQRRLGHITTL